MEENKMGVMPVNKLLVTMSLPIVISMLIQALYNIVDSLFVARIGEDALTAVSLAFPIQNLIIGIAVGTGVGVNALLSRNLGKKDMQGVNKVAMNGIFLAFASYLIFLVFGIFFVEKYYDIQTSSKEIVTYGVQYLSVCTICSITSIEHIILERILMGTGRTLCTMVAQGTGAIINIVLDPILIFGWFGIPSMGVVGAAIATVIGQTCGFILALFFNLKLNHEVCFQWKLLKPDKVIIVEIYKVGIPAIIMQSLASFMTFGLNKILMAYTTTAAAVLGIYLKLQSFIFMPVFGINNGMIPIIGYNYGANKPKRIVRVIKLSMAYGIGIMVIGFGTFQIFSKEIMMMFNASQEMLEIGVVAFRIISIGFLFAGVSVVLSSVFQALGNGMMSLIISVIRQLIILLPMAYILAKIFGMNTLWWAFPISEIFAGGLSILFLGILYKKTIKKLKEE